MAAMPFLMPVMPDQSDTCFSERKLFSAVIEQRHPGSRRLTSLLILFFSLLTADALYSLGTTRSNTRHTFFSCPYHAEIMERKTDINIHKHTADQGTILGQTFIIPLYRIHVDHQHHVKFF